MKRIGLYIVMLFSLIPLKAEIIEKLMLKNGSVLEGYVSVQHPGKDLIFVADKATLSIPSDKIVSIIDKDVKLDELSKTWQLWAKDNPGLVKKINGQSYITLSDIFVKDKAYQALPDSLLDKFNLSQKKMIPSHHNVRIVERGNHVKFLDCSSVSYNFTWDKVEQIERIPRDSKMLSGLVDEFYLKSGFNVKGQTVKTIIGKEICVLDNNNVVQSVPLKEIVSHKKTALNAEQPLMEQVMMLDVIRSSKGVEIKGLVVTQNYGTEKEEGYLSVMKQEGGIERVYISEIVEMSKEMNMQYSPIEDLIVKGSELYVARKLFAKATIETKNELCLIAKNSPLLELSLDSIQNNLVVEQLDEPDNRNLILFKLVDMKVSREMRKAFTFEDLLIHGTTPKSENVTVNGTLKQVFPIIEKGDYILYRTKKREAFYCRIK